MCAPGCVAVLSLTNPVASRYATCERLSKAGIPVTLVLDSAMGYVETWIMSSRAGVL